jgi:transcriptional regulator with XRE-family HTH domain
MSSATDLAALLRKRMKDEGWTWREFEAFTGLSKSALANIIDNPDVTPGLETLTKLARAFKMPLWRVVEMAGFDLELSHGDLSQTQRLASLMQSMPQYRPVVDYLVGVEPDDLEGILVYLETLQRRRSSGHVA